LLMNVDPDKGTTRFRVSSGVSIWGVISANKAI
jgi:hypothetical protein